MTVSVVRRVVAALIVAATIHGAASADTPPAPALGPRATLPPMSPAEHEAHCQMRLRALHGGDGKGGLYARYADLTKARTAAIEETARRRHQEDVDSAARDKYVVEHLEIPQAALARLAADKREVQRAIDADTRISKSRADVETQIEAARELIASEGCVDPLEQPAPTPCPTQASLISRRQLARWLVDPRCKQSQRSLPSKPRRSVAVGAAGVAVQNYSAPGKTLLAQSRVNVLAPTRVPTGWGRTYPTVQRYTDYKTNRQVGYDVVLGGPGCTGGTACTQADVYGEKAPPIEQTRLEGKVVATRLADGTPAKYVNGPCGANCAGSFQLQFVKGGYTYTISIKGGTLADGLLIASYLRPVASLP